MRTRKLWVLALIPLALGLGFLGSSRSNPPLPKFLREFESNVVEQKYWRHAYESRTMTPTYQTYSTYTVKAPVQEVARSLANQFGSNSLRIDGGIVVRYVSSPATAALGPHRTVMMFQGFSDGQLHTHILVTSFPRVNSSWSIMLSRLAPGWFNSGFAPKASRSAWLPPGFKLGPKVT